MTLESQVRDPGEEINVNPIRTNIDQNIEICSKYRTIAVLNIEVVVLGDSESKYIG